MKPYKSRLPLISVLLLSLLVIVVYSNKNGDSSLATTASKIETTETSLNQNDLEHTASSTNDAADKGTVSTQAHNKFQHWNDSHTILEKRISNETNPGAFTTVRIVNSDGFTSPILIEEEREKDSKNGEDITLTSKAYIANQFVVYCTDSLMTEEISEIEATTNWTLVDTAQSKHSYIFETNEIGFDEVDNALAKLNILDFNENNTFAEPNYIVYSYETHPDDVDYLNNGQWGLSNDADFDIDAPEGWNIQTDATEIIIAITDTGIRHDHKDLLANMWNNPEEVPNNWIDDDKNGYVDDVYGVNIIEPRKSPEDGNGHGTHVAGITAASGNNRIGISGVAWNAKLIAIKFLNDSGKGTTSDAINAIDYAIDAGAKIINASWGGESSIGLGLAIKRAEAAGVVIVAAAGNEGRRTNFTLSNGDHPNLISVASIGKDGQLSDYSNYGPNIAIAAPGEDILSTWYTRSSAYKLQSGTSMSAPFVSGVLALNMAYRPQDTYQRQIERLIESAKPNDSLKGKVQSQGIVSLKRSLEMNEVSVRPRITKQPEGRILLLAGQPLLIDIEIESDGETTYQWHKDDVLQSGQSNPSFSIKNTSLANSGTYRFTSRNEFGETSIEFDVVILEIQTDLLEGLDTESIPILPSEENTWKYSINEYSKGGDHIECPAPEPFGSYSIETTVQGPINFRFLWKFENLNQTLAQASVRIDDELYSLSSKGDWKLFTTELKENRSYKIEWLFSNWSSKEFPSDGSLIIDALGLHPIGKVPPITYYHPENRTITEGDSTTLFSRTSGSPTLDYQWHRNDQPIDTESVSTLSLSNVGLNRAGEYWHSVSNDFGTDTSNKTMISVKEKVYTDIYFPNQESTHNVATGEALTLAPKFEGQPPFSFKWFKDDIEIPGETERTLSINPLTPAHSGSYKLQIANATSQSYFTMKIYVRDTQRPPSSLFPQPEFQSLMRTLGSYTGLYYIIYSETYQGITLQWYHNHKRIEGAVSEEYVIEGLKANDRGVYSVEVTSEYGSFYLDLYEIIIEEPSIDYPDAELIIATSDPDNTGNFTLQTTPSTEARNIEFHWYASSPDDTINVFIDPLRLFSTAPQIRLDAQHSSKQWNYATLHIPAGKSKIVFEGLTKEETSTIYIDRISNTKAPATQKPAYATRLITREDPTVNIEVFGEGPFSYQWKLNSIPIAGQTTSTLSVDIDQLNETDLFSLEVSSPFGKIDSSNFSIADLGDALGADGLNLRTRGDVPFVQDPNLSNCAYAALDIENRSKWIEFDVTGPFAFAYNKDGFISTPNQVFIGETELIGKPSVLSKELSTFGYRPHTVTIPEGYHTVRLGAEFDETNPRPVKVYSLIPIRKPDINTLFVPYPTVAIAGAEPLSMVWYKNDEIFRTESTLSKNQFTLFDDEISVEDSGAYYCKVTDVNGNISISDTFTIDPLSFVGFSETLDTSEVTMYPRSLVYAADKNTVIEGQYSAKFSTWTYNLGSNFTLSLQIEDEPFAENQLYEIWIKLSKGDEGTNVKISDYDNLDKDLELTGEWQRVEFTRPNGYLDITIDLPSETEYHFWIDGLKKVDRLPRPRILKQPYDNAIYLNGDVTFSVEVQSNRPINYRWFKDGTPLANARDSHYSLEHIKHTDFGKYSVEIYTEGQTLRSREATLSLAPDYSSALGVPGLKARSYGHAIWTIDKNISTDGNWSTRAGDINSPEVSVLRIDFEQPLFYSYYYLEEYAEKELNLSIWTPLTDHADYIEITYDQQTTLGDLTPRPIRLDRLSILPTSLRSFETWVQKRINNIDAENDRTIPLNQTTLSDRFADTDGDSISNIIEYALNLDPLSYSQLPPIKTSITDEEIIVSIIHDTIDAGDITLSFQASNDLKNWRFIGSQSTPINTGRVNEYQKNLTTVNAALPPNGDPIYLRWNLSFADTPLTSISSASAPITITSGNN